MLRNNLTSVLCCLIQNCELLWYNVYLLTFQVDSASYRQWDEKMSSSLCKLRSKGRYGAFCLRMNAGVQVKLWDPLITRVIPERLRRYTNACLLTYLLTERIRLMYVVRKVFLLAPREFLPRDCTSAALTVVRCLSVHLSVCHTRVCIDTAKNIKRHSTSKPHSCWFLFQISLILVIFLFWFEFILFVTLYVLQPTTCIALDSGNS